VTVAHAIAVLRRHPRPLRLITARLLQRSGLSRLFTIRLDGYALRFFPTNLSANLWIDPSSRFHDLSIFLDYCRPGDLVVDVGANIGEVAIVCSQRVGDTGRVVAFEPHPRIFNYLQGNLALNRCSNVTARPVALGSGAATARMSDDRRDDMNRLTTDGAIEIACSTLDAEVPDRPVALLKVDVEGTELQVLRGAAATLRRTQCVNCELIDEHCRRYGHSPAEVIGLLRAAGFGTYIVQAPRRLQPVTESFAGTGAYELIAVRNPAAFLERTGWTAA
jgi:FkbM family methyltransferase